MSHYLDIPQSKKEKDKEITFRSTGDYIFHNYEKLYPNIEVFGGLNSLIKNVKIYDKESTINNYPIDFNQSYLYDKLENIIINIEGIYNHTIIKDCYNIVININGSCSSGIDILTSQNCILNVNNNSWLNIEHSSNIHVNGEGQGILMINHCMFVYHNKKDLIISPFNVYVYQGEILIS